MEKEPSFTGIELNETLLRSFFAAFKKKQNNEDLIRKLPDPHSISRKEAINKLAGSLDHKKLVMVLGAGVSMGFGLPDWGTLLQKLMITTIEEDQSSSRILSKLFSSIFSPSPLIAGRYLQ